MKTLNANIAETWPGFMPRPFIKPIGAICLLLAFLLCISFADASNTGTDSTKQKYALNDPRNPDCPCHKYQQQAEKEYQEQLLRQHNYSTDPLEALYDKGWQKGLSRKSQKTKTYGLSRWYSDYKLNRTSKRGKTKKGKPRYGVCFSWR
jgi:hypothetical protein